MTAESVVADAPADVVDTVDAPADTGADTVDAPATGADTEGSAKPSPETAGAGWVRNPRLRWAIYNGSAAGAGVLGIWSATGDPMAGADYAGRMAASVPQLAAAGLAVGAGIAGWHAARMVLLHRLPGLLGYAARPVAAIGGAMWGQGTAPLVRDGMAAIEPWGSLLAPLLAVGPLAAACWWGLDRRAAHAPLPVRWLARVPLATITISSLLYAPGVLL
ncbi:hypothetical protein [Streptomyces sp. NPDC092952]|uniref:hypothetical protein n=1 Tax=Streptomyces sp. NPDC092952 TaxID=3366018 RepID=UPI003819660E